MKVVDLNTQGTVYGLGLYVGATTLLTEKHDQLVLVAVADIHKV